MSPFPLGVAPHQAAATGSGQLPSSGSVPWVPSPGSWSLGQGGGDAQKHCEGQFAAVSQGSCVHFCGPRHFRPRDLADGACST